MSGVNLLPHPVRAAVLQDDLVCLPPKLAERLGNIGPIVLCTRVASSLTLLDPLTLRHSQVEVRTGQPHQVFVGIMVSKVAAALSLPAGQGQLKGSTRCAWSKQRVAVAPSFRRSTVAERDHFCSASSCRVLAHDLAPDRERVPDISAAAAQAPVYWRNPFRTLLHPKQLVEFTVLDIEPLDAATSKHTLAEAQVDGSATHI